MKQLIRLSNYEYEDIETLFASFQETLKPKRNGTKEFSDLTIEDEKEYTEIIKWLKDKGYYIKQFPNTIQRQQNFKSFAYDEIRSYIRVNKGYGASDSIPWSERRELITKLKLCNRSDYSSFNVNKDLDHIIKDISNGRGYLDTQTVDDQLATLCNCIEYFLKEKKKFKEISSDVFYGFLDNNDLKKFRQDTQIFRHATKETLEERKFWDDNRKKFYIRLGINMVTKIHQKSKDSQSY